MTLKDYLILKMERFGKEISKSILEWVRVCQKRVSSKAVFDHVMFRINYVTTSVATNKIQVPRINSKNRKLGCDEEGDEYLKYVIERGF
jgi:hypothetical protein